MGKLKINPWKYSKSLLQDTIDYVVNIRVFVCVLSYKQNVE